MTSNNMQFSRQAEGDEGVIATKTQQPQQQRQQQREQQR